LIKKHVKADRKKKNSAKGKERSALKKEGKFFSPASSILLSVLVLSLWVQFLQSNASFSQSAALTVVVKQHSLISIQVRPLKSPLSQIPALHSSRSTRRSLRPRNMRRSLLLRTIATTTIPIPRLRKQAGMRIPKRQMRMKRTFRRIPHLNRPFLHLSPNPSPKHDPHLQEFSNHPNQLQNLLL
jgi:hypothetical protein